MWVGVQSVIVLIDTEQVFTWCVHYIRIRNGVLRPKWLTAVHYIYRDVCKTGQVVQSQTMTALSELTLEESHFNFSSTDMCSF